MSHTDGTRKRKATQPPSSSSSTAHEHIRHNNDPLLELGLTQIDAGDSEDDEIKALDEHDSDSSEDSLGLAADDIFSEQAASDDEDRDLNLSTYRVEEDANGNQRFVYPEIDPTYDSDDSDAKEAENTIGDIPLSFYDSYPHIGYDVNGKKIMRPAKGAALDSLLDSIDIPKGWTGLTDPATGKPLELSSEELDVLKRLTRHEPTEDGYDPYPEMVEWFSSRTEQMPLSAAPEPKRRFVPSKHEAKRIMKLVRAIKEGRIQPYRAPQSTNEDEEGRVMQRYDLWADEAPRPDHPMHVPAPKLPPPGYQESYHPPPEYLPDEEEQKAWLELDEEDRQGTLLPQDHGSLRKTPGYSQLVKERFERSLDLYLAPRVRRNKLNIDPESLLPKLPSPEELRPFPSRQDMVMRGHSGRVRTAAIDPHGEYLATGGDDGTVKVWWLATGYQLWSCRLSDQDAIAVVSWRPVTGSLVLAACAGEHVFMIAPALPVFTLNDADPVKTAQELLQSGFVFQKTSNGSASAAPGVREAVAKWRPPESKLRARGVIVQITLRSTIKQMSWHRRGGYFATVAPQGQSNAVAIHTLAKHLTQLPFRRLKGLPQAVRFHPSKPIFFVATQRMIRSYDLAKQELLKTLQPGTRWISSFDVHAGGDNLIVASYDKKLLWMDLDLSTRPYKTLRYHTKAIRSAAFHQAGYPLFADCSDDGSVQVFHGKVVNDFMENANIVPLRVLRGHRVVAGLGVLSMEWFPNEPWLVSTGADGTIRTWHS